MDDAELRLALSAIEPRDRELLRYLIADVILIRSVPGYETIRTPVPGS